MANQIRWYDLLTLDHTVCRICFAAGERGTSIGDHARAAGRPLKGDRFRERAVYIASLRAAFKRHIEAAHPDWVERVRWVKD